MECIKKGQNKRYVQKYSELVEKCRTKKRQAIDEALTRLQIFYKSLHIKKRSQLQKNYIGITEHKKSTEFKRISRKMQDYKKEGCRNYTKVRI